MERGASRRRSEHDDAEHRPDLSQAAHDRRALPREKICIHGVDAVEKEDLLKCAQPQPTGDELILRPASLQERHVSTRRAAVNFRREQRHPHDPLTLPRAKAGVKKFPCAN
jgi:hypothetical protein